MSEPSVEVGVEGTPDYKALYKFTSDLYNAAQSKLTRLEKVLRECPWPAYTEGTRIAVCVVCKQLPHKYRDCPVFALESAKKLLEEKREGQ